MKEGYTHRKSSMVLPILIGTAAGAGIALLLAPKSGKELRKDLKRFAANTGEQVAEVIDEGKELYGEGRKAVERAVEAGRESYEEAVERLDELVHKKERSLMVPIVVSGIIGAGIAFLVAPKTGKAVREDIKRIAGDTRDKVVSFMDKGKDLGAKGMKAYREEKKKVLHAA